MLNKIGLVGLIIASPQLLANNNKYVFIGAMIICNVSLFLFLINEEK
jgi:hypothetical protein